MRAKCSYCDREMIRRRAANGKHVELARTKDHFIPQSQGGYRTILSCHGCNSLKGAMSFEEWQLFMDKNPSWWLLTKQDLRKVRKQFIKEIQIWASFSPPSNHLTKI
jgi:hypothetical protein